MKNWKVVIISIILIGRLALSQTSQQNYPETSPYQSQITQPYIPPQEGGDYGLQSQPPSSPQPQQLQIPSGQWAIIQQQQTITPQPQPQTTITTPQPESKKPESSTTKEKEYKRWGLGFSNHFSPIVATYIGWLERAKASPFISLIKPPDPIYINLRFRYKFSRKVELDTIFGFGYYYFNKEEEWGEENKEWDGTMEQFGIRSLYSLVTTERADLYIGGGVGFIYGKVRGPGSDPETTEYFTFLLQLPLGIEYRFESIPNLSLSGELSFSFNYTTYSYELQGSDEENKSYMLGVGLGGSSSTPYLPLINYLTLGITYWF